jgi:hypothetical protein
MTWELVVIGTLVLLIGGIAGWAMRRGKSELHSFSANVSTNIDSDELAQKIAKATGAELRLVLREFLNELKKTKVFVPQGVAYEGQERSDISIDESIIPIDVQIDVESTNLESAATEEKVVDTDLEKSKSRLAGILNKNKE